MTRILTPDGSLDPQIDADPRVSQSQQESMLRAARADPVAEVVGVDAEIRPVIQARLGGATQPSQYALFRNGQATKVTEPLTETWT